MIDYSDDDSSVRLLRVCADRLARNTAWAQFGEHSVEIVGVAREDTVSEIRVKDLTSASVGRLSDLDDSANQRIESCEVRSEPAGNRNQLFSSGNFGEYLFASIVAGATVAGDTVAGATAPSSDPQSGRRPVV